LLLKIEERIRSAVSATAQPVSKTQTVNTPPLGAPPATTASGPNPKLPPCTQTDLRGNRWRLGLCDFSPAQGIAGEAKPPVQSATLPQSFTDKLQAPATQQPRS